jgi:Zn-dependent metalloprotease
MKTIKLISVILLIPLITCAQGTEVVDGSYEILRNNKKEISFYILTDTDKAYSARSDFFEGILDISKDDEFKFLKRGNDRSDKYFEEYRQYYKGIKVKSGVFILHWDNGYIKSANGNYIRTSELKVKPSFTEKEAVLKWCDYLKIPYKKVDRFKSELMVIDMNEYNESETKSKIALAYRIRLYSKLESNELIGYVDAHSGIICFTEPIALTFSSGRIAKKVKSDSNITPIPVPFPIPSPSYSDFVTRYSGLKEDVRTDTESGVYYLEDWTRGDGIETLDLEEKTVDYIGEAISITNNSSYWDSTDFEDEFGNAALDVHWGLQAIYDYYLNIHGREGWDSAGQKVNAYVHAILGDEGKDGAAYFPDDEYEVMLFGDGQNKFKPVVALDVVIHEYAHGINDHTSAFGVSGISRSFNEALSDIWAAIIEDYLAPYDPNWLIGDKVMKLPGYDVLRNLEVPNDPGAWRRMADTYGSERYYSDTNVYFRSGVMSHFFYLLCNGGSDENELGNDYQVYKIDMDDAADLIYIAQAERYLNGTTTYPLMRSEMLEASDEFFGENSLESMQVANAWYAVGVGSEPDQISITCDDENYTMCPYGETFTIDNLPAGCSVSWNSSNNITRTITAYGEIFAAPSSSGPGWIQATITSNNYSTSITLDQYEVTIESSPWLYYIVPEYGNYYGYEGNSYSFHVWPENYPNYTFNIYPPYAYINWVQGAVVNIYFPYPDIPFTISAYTTGASCKSNTVSLQFYVYGMYFLLSPNPASNEVTITITGDKSDNSMDLSKADRLYDVSIFDINGNLKIKKEYSGEKFSIPIHNLKDGEYLVRINDGKMTVTKRLIIKH